ncbi:MAG: sulfate reduction electron transfer complex DsrMKJOP subunit DsrM [Alphaproteobacteria bacterium]|uniref:Sulfate reduction electron transfer complex DsrMKJOP subunit DsrM n=1 Tax=Candidatus Nitrobium versatile TaxID=2884831 RepID=A0A953M172_9BACT|nr:sulfate reduction electron transfer complex DsrMKJOP subunit DsrM [Candidatus Nitrobium versatile]
MKILIPFFAVVALILLVAAGVKATGLEFLFGVLIPYAAVATFAVGIVLRVVKWARSPVPFRIPTTCGQQKSLPWIKENKIENPSSTLGVIARMALEVLFFRSLFRNIKTELRNDGSKLAYGSDKWLWLAGLAFHWSFLIILVRHFRFFAAHVPFPIRMVEGLDSFLQIGAPLLYITDLILLGAVTYLFFRRVALPMVRYISLPADYFPLFLILGIAGTGVLMRYFTKVDVTGVKQLAMGLVSFTPVVPEGIGALFYVHLFLVSVLFAYFPFSKLVHMAGVFLSPTRNMVNNSRMVRHVNPWNHPVHVHTYEEYENDFREKMKMAGIPVEKE